MHEDGIVYLIEGKCNKCEWTFENQTVVYKELTQTDAEGVVRTMHGLTGCTGTTQASIKHDVAFEDAIAKMARLVGLL